jgi:membrane associated rhomboid family serine protease
MTTKDVIKQKENREEIRGMKRALIVLLVGIGFLVMVVGLVTDLYDFAPVGLLGWLSAWILAFTLLALFGPIGSEATCPCPEDVSE